MRDLIDQRNKAEAGIMDTEQKLDEFSDQISSEKKTELTEKLEALRADLTNDDVTGDDLREKWHELQKEVMSVFSEAYSKKAAENSGNESSEQPAEEKKEEKKEEGSSSDRSDFAFLFLSFVLVLRLVI